MVDPIALSSRPLFIASRRARGHPTHYKRSFPPSQVSTACYLLPCAASSYQAIVGIVLDSIIRNGGINDQAEALLVSVLPAEHDNLEYLGCADLLEYASSAALLYMVMPASKCRICVVSPKYMSC